RTAAAGCRTRQNDRHYPLHQHRRSTSVDLGRPVFPFSPTRRLERPNERLLAILRRGRHSDGTWVQADSSRRTRWLHSSSLLAPFLRSFQPSLLLRQGDNQI